MKQTINISPSKKIVISLKIMMEQKETRRKKIIKYINYDKNN